METAVTELKQGAASHSAFVRLLEIFPGFMTWLFLIGPVVLSLVQPILVAYFIIAFDLMWLIKSLRMSFYLLKGYGHLQRDERVDWVVRLKQLQDVQAALEETSKQLELQSKVPGAHRRLALTKAHLKARRRYLELKSDLVRLQQLADVPHTIINPNEIYNVVILATYNESLEILEPSVKSLVKADFSHEKMILVIAYEQRGGQRTKDNADYLVDQYRQDFAHVLAYEHPDGIPGEVRGKGANISFAGRHLALFLSEQQIDPEKVIVTTFDADHRPGRHYFSYLTYVYATDPNRVHRSYQPIPMFYNNIWDAPAPMRVIATGNSFWMIMESMRPRRLRNFAAHAQSLKALIEVDFWSVTSIVEDGHQYWRTYFAYNGDHQVVPIFTPVYQDAVLAKTYGRTFRMQYLQLRRWAWGVSDFPYVVLNSVQNRQIPWRDKLQKIWQLFEGHFSWATAPLILTFVAWLPLFLNQDFAEKVIAHQLPVIASRILTLTMIGLVATLMISLISLPPKPPRYRRTRIVSMVLQWLLLPVVAICFSAFAAIDAQTRLILGRYLDFRVTEKARR